MNKPYKVLVVAVIVILVCCFLSLIYFLITNTSLLNIYISPESIDQNNSNNKSISPEIPDTQSQDFTELIEQELEGHTMNLPIGFKISIFARGLVTPRFMDFDLEDNLYVTDKDAGKVLLIKDNEKDGTADETINVDSNLNTPHGIDYYQGNLYVAEEHQLVVYKDIETNGKYSLKQVVIANLPSGSGHSTRTVVIGSDNKIYMAVGSSCNVCEEKDRRRAAIIRYNMDGSGEEIFAEGLRNTVGFVFDDQNRMWGVDNGRDRIGDDIPPEEVNIIEAGKHYGWPYCYGKGITNPEFVNKSGFCKTESSYPTFELQAHSAPLSLTFIPANSNLPSSFQADIFITYHGSWNRTIPTGYKIVRIDSDDSSAEPVNFITGWLEEKGNVWGRPVDIKFNSKDEIFVTDDKAGIIYKISYSIN